MVVDDDDASFKKPGAVPFKWEIRPGVPKIRPGDDRTLLQPPKKLTPLKFKPSPPSKPSSPSSSSSSSSEYISRPVSPFAPPPSFKPSPDSESHSSGPPSPYFRSSTPRAHGGVLPPPNLSSVISEYKSRPVSPFAPPPSFKPSPDSESHHSSGPPTPYFKSSTPRAHGGVLPKLFPKSFFGMKKSKSGELKKTAQESSSSLSSDSYNFRESESENSSSGSFSSRGSSNSSVSSRRSSRMKRIESDLSSYEKKTLSMMDRSRLG